MQLTETILQEARELIRARDFGILSTLSVHLEGLPFGSVANYCLDADGHPLLLLSDIAQHTINALADKRSSLTILENSGNNVQSEARITVSGSLLKDDITENKERYELYFPESKAYHDFHDFTVFRLNPTSVRYIGGFGKIFWIEPKEFYADLSMKPESKDFIIEHMNDHHVDSLVAYAQHYLGISLDESVRMIGVDSTGIDMQHNGSRLRVKATEQMDENNARKVLVAMAKEAASMPS